MRDLQSGWAMWLKAGLFLVIGMVSAGLILAEAPDGRVAVLLALAVWSFCRAYYFLFYVIERYLDPTFRYAGLLSAVRHFFTQKSRAKMEDGGAKEIDGG